jgi:excisionase family DNA binding protein
MPHDMLANAGRRLAEDLDAAQAVPSRSRQEEADGPPDVAQVLDRAGAFVRSAAAAAPELEPERDRFFSLPIAQADLDYFPENRIAPDLVAARSIVLRMVEALENAGRQTATEDLRGGLTVEQQKRLLAKGTLTVKETALLLGYSERYIYRLLDEGRLRRAKMTGKAGSAVRILSDTVRDMLSERNPELD